MEVPQQQQPMPPQQMPPPVPQVPVSAGVPTVPRPPPIPAGVPTVPQPPEVPEQPAQQPPPAPTTNVTAEVKEEPKKKEPLLIPKAAVKRIMKIDKDVNQVANDAVILVAKATELFLEKLTREAYGVAEKENRKQIKYEDLSDAREKDPDLSFLEHIMPTPLQLEECNANNDPPDDTPQSQHQVQQPQQPAVQPQQPGPMQVQIPLPVQQPPQVAQVPSGGVPTVPRPPVPMETSS